MSAETETRRRDFLKASVLAGVAGAAAPLAAQGADESGGQPALRQPPPALRAAERGAVETRLDAAHADRERVTDPGSDFMVEVIRESGIRYVAATAGSTFRGLQESIVNHAGNKNPEFIVCVHEEISAGIAHGYAKVAGEPMACLLHSNVGLQHASMAIYNAWCDRVPMMAIVANIYDATKRRPGVEWLHTATDVASMVRDFVKWDDAPASLQHFAESFMRACEIAKTPPCLPVLIVADGELQENQIRDRAALKIPRRAAVAAPAAETKAIEQVAGLLIDAEAP